jgi:hypothetical protein
VTQTPAKPPVAAGLEVADKLLEQGEIIIFAIKPSPWFVLLVSWPVLAAAVAVPILMYASDLTLGLALGLSQRLVVLVCAAAATARVLAASFQWMGKIFILTNRRVVRVQGVTRVQVLECLLRDIGDVQVTAGVAQRALGIGNLVFDTADDCQQAPWLDVPRPAEVQKQVQQAISKAKKL